MPDLPILLSFVVAAFVVVLVPGITVSAVVSTALARGLAAGLWLEAGVQVGRFTMVLVVALALEAVTGAVAAAFDLIKYAGAAYLVWIGWGYLTHKASIDTSRPVAETTPLRQMLSGFLVLWGNPKALIFFGAFLPQFVDPRYPAWPQVIVLGLIEMAAGLITDSGYIWVAATARDALTSRGLTILNRVAGIILIGAAVWLALQHQA
jgi:threonine/homoserine/homoserine lactone efflux protein